MSSDPWAVGPGATGGHDLPPRPDAATSSGLAQPPAVTGKPTPSKLARRGGAVMMVLAGLLLLGGFSRVSNPDYHYETVGLYLMILLCGGSVAGGLYLYKKGWQQGHDFVNVMSILPAAVLVVLIAFGALAQATRHNPPTDAYGYTEAERQMFVSGCGGGGRCECLFSEIERSIPHDQFIAESRRYNQTGSFSSEFVSRLTEIDQSSGC
jgi:hypothetical protein